MLLESAGQVLSSQRHGRETWTAGSCYWEQLNFVYMVLVLFLTLASITLFFSQNLICLALFPEPTSNFAFAYPSLGTLS